MNEFRKSSVHVHEKGSRGHDPNETPQPQNHKLLLSTLHLFLLGFFVDMFPSVFPWGWGVSQLTGAGGGPGRFTGRIRRPSSKSTTSSLHLSTDVASPRGKIAVKW